MVQSISLPVRRPVPIITSPAQKPIQQTSAHSTATTNRERNSGSSQMWPNKPKRVYEVIPNLNDSRKTSRQSSVGGTHDQIKISEIRTPQSSAKPSEKRKDFFLNKAQLISRRISFQIYPFPVFNFVVIIIMDLKLKKWKFYRMIQKILILDLLMK